MSQVLEHAAPVISSSDLYDRGFGESGVDFLKAERKASNIVTNPPYNSAEGFVRSGLVSAQLKFALLLRLAFLKGPTGSGPYSPLRRRRESGFSASGSRFIPRVPSGRAVARPLTLGSAGIRTPPAQRSFAGSTLATSHATPQAPNREGRARRHAGALSLQGARATNLSELF